ncbi:MAG: flagellar hook-length control protein FliK [Polyangiales bacterium]
MKGVDALGPMLEPTPQAGEGTAKTKDGKNFDAVLAEVVEKDPTRAKGAKLIAPAGEKTADKGVLARAMPNAAATAELPDLVATPETVVTPKLAELEAVEEPEKLEEPKTAQQEQVMLGQIASVVARIVVPPQSAPVQAPKPEAVAATQAATPALPAPPPANDVAPPVRAQDFNDALHGLQIVPHDAHEAQTVRPGISESTAPAAGEEPRGPIGRALQALKGDSAPMRAAADKVMNAFRALSGREQVPPVSTPMSTQPMSTQPTSTQPTPTPPMPSVQTAPSVPTAPGVQTAPSLQTASRVQTAPSATTGQTAPATMAKTPNVVPSAPNAAANGAASTHSITVAGNQAPPLAAPTQAPASSPVTPDMPTVRPGAPQPPAQTITVSGPDVPQLPGQPGQPVQGQPVQGQTLALSEQPQPEPAQPAQGMPQHNVVLPQQAANNNAAQPVVVQVQPQAQPGAEAVSEEAVREQGGSDKSEGEPRERVHGFSRGGWTDQARSAYGGRGHEGSSSDRGSDRGETTRTIKREEERASERAGEQGAPQFMPEQFIPEPQLTQAPQQAQETPNANVPQNQPAAPAAPVQELPDIVFQGRPDPTAATENASISLHHPDLGPIQLEVHREQGRVEVHAVIESQHAQAVLRANESGIRQGVQQAGMTFNALRVRVRGEEQSSNRPGQERRRQRNERET